jgi:hypothetical protein
VENILTLGEKRRQFSLDIAILIVWANREGYGIAIDDVKAHDGHIKNSKHYDGLAADLNLYFYLDGKWVYQTTTEAHLKIGEEWERMGHKWGGRFNDGNHYEI